MNKTKRNQFHHPRSLALLTLLLMAAVPNASWASAMSCAAAVGRVGRVTSLQEAEYLSPADQKLLQAATDLDTILNGPAHLQEMRAAEFIDSTFLQTVNELSSFLHDQNNFVTLDLNASELSQKATKNIDFINNSLVKVTKLANNESKLLARYSSLFRGSPEVQLAKLQKEIQFAHHEILQNRDDLMTQNSRLVLLIQHVDQKVGSLESDSELLQNMLQTLRSAGASHDLELKFLRAQESISLLHTLARSLIQGSEQRLQVNRAMIDSITAQTSGSIPLAAVSTQKPVDFKPRSRARQLIESLQKSELNPQQKSAIVMASNLPSIKNSELFELLKIIGSSDTVFNEEIYTKLSPKLSDHLSDYGMDWILLNADMIKSESLAKTLRLGGTTIALAQYFRLGQLESFRGNSNAIFNSIPPELYSHLDEMKGWVEQTSGSVNPSSCRVLVHLMGANHLNYEQSMVWYELLNSRMNVNLQAMVYETWNDYMLKSGFALDQDLTKLIKSHLGNLAADKDLSFLQGLENLITSNRGQITGAQALKILKSIPSQSVRSTGTGSEKYFDGLKMALRHYLHSDQNLALKDAFTSSDLELMGADMNLVMMMKTLQGLKSGPVSSSDILADLKNEAFRILQSSGVHDIAENPNKQNLKRPVDRGTTVSNLNAFFQSLITSRG